jgi:undecaprenyl diphosphate synthase
MRPAGETRRPFSLSALAEKKIPRSSGAIAPELALHRASEGGYYQKTDSMSLDQLLEWIPAGGPEEALARQVEFDRLPRHVAIIMDGNGRWAGERRLPRVEGHRAGVDAVRDVVETSARLGLEVLTLYAFSVENWKRPAAEVSTLMALLKRYLRLELDTLLGNNIRFNVLGRADALASDIQTELLDAERKTAKNTGLLFNIALNYGGRSEIVDAARRMLEAGVTPAELDEDKFASFLYTAGQPDPDLLIRTSGEMRVSNFLLWQIAYAEIWVTDTLWPDFRCRHLLEAVVEYQKRDRRFGGITPPVPAGVR